MFHALNMDLNIIRTVIKNQTNEISVCTDQKRDAEVFYTLISVFSVEITKYLIQKINSEGLFTSNQDYIGSFTFKDSFNLVFRYRAEKRLGSGEAAYATSFARRKELAGKLIVACAETEITGAVGCLLLAERNVNLSPQGEVYFNYFMDFGALSEREEGTVFYSRLAGCAFDIMTREYNLRYDGQIDEYPSELQVFYRKNQEKKFQSFNHLLTFLNMLPDAPQERRTGVRRVYDRASGVRGFIARHSMAIFLSVLIFMTACFLVWQVVARISNRSSNQAVTTYMGMDAIGEVYLGEEDV